MASITIRNLPNQIKESLRIKAAKSGMSLEAYVRTVLKQASKTDTEQDLNIMELAQKYFGPDGGIDLELPKRGSHREPVGFEK